MRLHCLCDLADKCHKQAALQNIVRYAEILGAESLCSVTKATVFCGAHHYLGACKSGDFDLVFFRLN